MQVTWHLLGMLFWEIYEIFSTGFTRNTRECRLLQLVVAENCFNQKMFFKKYLIRFDIEWHVLPRIKCITDVWRPFMMFILVCIWFFRFTSVRASLFIWTTGNVTSIVSITHTLIFSEQEVCETVARKNNCKLKFCSMYCIWNNEGIHLSFKNSEK